VRPERLHLAARREPGATAWPATVLDAIHQGDHWRVVARLQGLDMHLVRQAGARRTARRLAPGQPVTLSFSHDDAWLFPA
jgi:hypothetical protein